MSEVPQAYAWDVRNIGAQVQAARLRLEEVRHAVDDEPPSAA